MWDITKGDTTTYSCLSEDSNQTIDCVRMRRKKQQT